MRSFGPKKKQKENAESAAYEFLKSQLQGLHSFIYDFTMFFYSLVSSFQV